MKTTKLLRMVMLITFIVMQQIVVNCQNSVTSKYTVAYKDSNYTFKICEYKDFYSIKLVDATKIDTVYSTVNNGKALEYAVNDLIQNSSKRGIVSKSDISEISNNLQIMHDSKQRENALNSKINDLQNDKGAIVSYINLKNTSVKAYLIPTKKSDFGLIKVEKRLFSIVKKLEKDTFKLKSLATIIYDETRSVVNKSKLKQLYKDSPELLSRNILNLSIDSIDIAFENGIIKDVLVHSHDTVNHKPYNFSNLCYLPFRNAQDIDRLSCKESIYLTQMYNRDSILALDLADAIYFNRKVPQASGTYIPIDTTITLVNRNIILPLHKPTISETFDVRLYTDLMGYCQNNPNGIIQFEGQIDFFLNQGKNENSLYDLWNRRKYENYRNQCLWFNRISPYFKLMKIEDKKNVLAVSQNQDLKNIVDVYKYAKANLGIDLNIKTYRTDSKLFTGNLAGGVLFTTIGNDSITINNKDITTLYLNPNLDFKFFESNKIDFNVRFGGHLSWVASSYEDANFSNSIDKVYDYVTDKVNWMWQFQQSINLHINSNKGNSVFIRSAEYIGAKSNFFTFQIGYSSSLNNLLKF